MVFAGIGSDVRRKPPARFVERSGAKAIGESKALGRTRFGALEQARSQDLRFWGQNTF